MAYGDGKSGRPMERASKVGHSSLIEHPLVLQLLQQSHSTASTQRRINGLVTHQLPVADQPKIQNLISSGFDKVVAIDSGRRTITLQDREIRSTITFLSIGAVHLDITRYLALQNTRFVSSAAVAETHRVEKFDLALPERYLSRRGLSDRDSFRMTLHEFLLAADEEGDSLYDTLEWLLCRHWKPGQALSNIPDSANRELRIEEQIIEGKTVPYIRTASSGTQFPPLLGDTFGAHHLAGQESDASSQAMRIIEQLLSVHLYRRAVRAGTVDQTLFIVDGPLTIFNKSSGPNWVQDALMDMVTDMHEGLLPQMYVVGLEKNGVLAQHTKTDLSGDEDHDLHPGQYVIADTEHIRRHMPQQASRRGERYGRTTYWAVPILVRARSGVHYAASLLSSDIEASEDRAGTLRYYQTPQMLWQLERIVNALDGLESAMYEDALMPIALANQSVSLSASPGEAVLEQLVREQLSRG